MSSYLRRRRSMVPLVLGLWGAPRVARGATVPLGGLAHLIW